MLTPNSFWRDVKNAEPYTQGYWHGYYDLGIKVCSDYCELTLSPDDYSAGWSDGQDDRWAHVNDKGFGPGHIWPVGDLSLRHETFEGIVVALVGETYIFDPYCVLVAGRHYRHFKYWNALLVEELDKLRSV